MRKIADLTRRSQWKSRLNHHQSEFNGNCDNDDGIFMQIKWFFSALSSIRGVASKVMDNCIRIESDRRETSAREEIDEAADKILNFDFDLWSRDLKFESTWLMPYSRSPGCSWQINNPSRISSQSWKRKLEFPSFATNWCAVSRTSHPTCISRCLGF